MSVSHCFNQSFVSAFAVVPFQQVVVFRTFFRSLVYSSSCIIFVSCPSIEPTSDFESIPHNVVSICICFSSAHFQLFAVHGSCRVWWLLTTIHSDAVVVSTLTFYYFCLCCFKCLVLPFVSPRSSVCPFINKWVCNIWTILSFTGFIYSHGSDMGFPLLFSFTFLSFFLSTTVFVTAGHWNFGIRTHTRGLFIPVMVNWPLDD